MKDIRLTDLENAIERLIESIGRTDKTDAAWLQLVNVKKALSLMDEALRKAHIALTLAQLYMPVDYRDQVQGERDLIVETRNMFKTLMGFE